MKSLSVLGLGLGLLMGISGCSLNQASYSQEQHFSAGEQAKSNPNWQLNLQNKLVRKSYR